jgi:hypothetical protein
VYLAELVLLHGLDDRGVCVTHMDNALIGRAPFASVCGSDLRGPLQHMPRQKPTVLLELAEAPAMLIPGHFGRCVYCWLWCICADCFVDILGDWTYQCS